MSLVKLAKTYRQALMEFVNEYQADHPGPVNMLDVAAWAIKNGCWEQPRRSQIKQLAKELVSAARSARITDSQGCKVRAMHAAKTERVDANGNRIFDVVWDHIAEMSLDHAMASFTQRHSNIERQCAAHNRDVQSFNKNNPHACEIQLEFDYSFAYAVEEPRPQVVEKIDESKGVKPKPR